MYFQLNIATMRLNFCTLLLAKDAGLVKAASLNLAMTALSSADGHMNEGPVEMKDKKLSFCPKRYVIM
jgi:hypothetical protein